MKAKSIITLGCLAFASLFFSSHQAGASLSALYSDGDYVLGFYSPNKSNEFVIDLTKFGFNPAVTATYFNSSTHIGDDLSLSGTGGQVNAFGANWYANAAANQFYYGVVQTNNGVGDLAVTNPEPSSLWPSGPGQGGPSNDIATLGNQMSQKTQGNGQKSIGLVESKGAGSADWTTYVSYNASTTTNALDQAYTNPDFLGDGAVSDLVTNSLQFDQVYNQNGKTTKVLGTFSLDSAGDLTFQSAAVPEPGTVAAFGIGAAFLALVRRRSRR